MPELQSGVTGRKSGQDHTNIKPLLVSVKIARRILGDMSKSKFFSPEIRGRLEAVSDGGKVWITTRSIDKLVDELVTDTLVATKPKRNPNPKANAA